MRAFALGLIASLVHLALSAVSVSSMRHSLQGKIEDYRHIFVKSERKPARKSSDKVLVGGDKERRPR